MMSVFWAPTTVTLAVHGVAVPVAALDPKLTVWLPAGCETHT